MNFVCLHQLQPVRPAKLVRIMPVKLLYEARSNAIISQTERRVHCTLNMLIATTVETES